MHAEETPTLSDRTLRDIITGGPAKTFLAASILGLMWGPILASVLDVMDIFAEDETAQVEAGILAALPPLRPDLLGRPGGVAVTDVTALNVDADASDDAALERLKGMTRYNSLSNVDGPVHSEP